MNILCSLQLVRVHDLANSQVDQENPDGMDPEEAVLDTDSYSQAYSSIIYGDPTSQVYALVAQSQEALFEAVGNSTTRAQASSNFMLRHLRRCQFRNGTKWSGGHWHRMTVQFV